MNVNSSWLDLLEIEDIRELRYYAKRLEWDGRSRAMDWRNESHWMTTSWKQISWSMRPNEGTDKAEVLQTLKLCYNLAAHHPQHTVHHAQAMGAPCIVCWISSVRGGPPATYILSNASEKPSWLTLFSASLSPWWPNWQVSVLHRKEAWI